MATQEHKACANVVKNVHLTLRKLSHKIGYEDAWTQHCSDEDTLKIYAESMRQLGSDHWERNTADPNKDAVSRNAWIADSCHKYFFEGGLIHQQQREETIALKCGIDLEKSKWQISGNNKINILDVGSCYNPLSCYNFMDIIAVDLCPADGSVFACDFLNVPVGNFLSCDGNKIVQFKKESQDAIVFSLLLEYLPASVQRKLCCWKAYSLLKKEGILIVVTPDSKHVGANAKTMKNWRYTLAKMGFSRITYEKLPYLHCMVFRKSLDPRLAERWATMYKENFMQDEIHIPQDFQEIQEDSDDISKGFAEADTETTAQLFNHLPDCDL